MLMEWSDLQKGDTLVISKEALEARANESWAQEDYYRKSLFLITDIKVHDNGFIDVWIQDSVRERGPWHANLKSNGAMSGVRGDYPFFEILALAKEEQ